MFMEHCQVCQGRFLSQSSLDGIAGCSVSYMLTSSVSQGSLYLHLSWCCGTNPVEHNAFGEVATAKVVYLSF